MSSLQVQYRISQCVISTLWPYKSWHVNFGSAAVRSIIMVQLQRPEWRAPKLQNCCFFNVAMCLSLCINQTGLGLYVKRSKFPPLSREDQLPQNKWSTDSSLEKDQGVILPATTHHLLLLLPLSPLPSCPFALLPFCPFALCLSNPSQTNPRSIRLLLSTTISSLPHQLNSFLPWSYLLTSSHPTASNSAPVHHYHNQHVETVSASAALYAIRHCCFIQHHSWIMTIICHICGQHLDPFRRRLVAG
jgi:hypothetical protein